MKTLRLTRVLLSEPVSDPTDRGVMPMSTLIASDQWMFEAAWDGLVLGDVHIFRNANATSPTQRILAEDGSGPLPFAWVWWTGVPRGKVKQYFLEDVGQLQPMTADALPFATDVQREAKPRQAGKAGTASP
jgi:hypothetical protein